MLTSLVFALTCATGGATQPDPALLARDRALVAAFLDTDLAAIRDLYAEDAIVMPPNAPSIQGHAAIVPWAQAVGDALVAFSASPIRIHVSGDMAWIAGRYQMEVKSAAGPSTTDTGKYLEVWRRIEGRWRIVADMFNTDLPAK